MIKLLILLLLKHFVFDWWLQTDDEIRHKGTYLHSKGISHSFKHSLGTMSAVWFFTPDLAIPLGLADGLIHYHVDWAKQQWVSIWKLSPSDKTFWFAIGLDQLLHNLTYVAIASLALTKT